jgi:hypothetical protein
MPIGSRRSPGLVYSDVLSFDASRAVPQGRDRAAGSAAAVYPGLIPTVKALGSFSAKLLQSLAVSESRSLWHQANGMACREGRCRSALTASTIAVSSSPIDFNDMHAERGQIFRDIADILVLGAARQDPVADHQKCGRDGLFGGGRICDCHDHLQEDAPKDGLMQGESRYGFRPSGGADARPMTARVESRLRFVSPPPEPGYPGLAR